MAISLRLQMKRSNINCCVNISLSSSRISCLSQGDWLYFRSVTVHSPVEAQRLSTSIGLQVRLSSSLILRRSTHNITTKFLSAEERFMFGIVMLLPRPVSLHHSANLTQWPASQQGGVESGRTNDRLVSLKDMELDSAIPLQTVVISVNNWSYICRCRKALLLFKAA